MVQFESRVAKFFAQKIRQPRIFLQRQQTRAALQNLAGEGAKPGPISRTKSSRLIWACSTIQRARF